MEVVSLSAEILLVQLANLSLYIFTSGLFKFRLEIQFSLEWGKKFSCTNLLVLLAHCKINCQCYNQMEISRTSRRMRKG